ncbi:transposase IS200 like domain-containing protein [Ditylenchus destructor]|nr:transposase IS200 like domain-containing protein [Ditylenchus destructor]
MARLPRLALAGHLHHLIHRGHNLQPIVVDDEDRRALLAALQESAATHKVAIHAYVVMPNHLHLLATPTADDGLSRMMQALAGAMSAPSTCGTGGGGRSGKDASARRRWRRTPICSPSCAASSSIRCAPGPGRRRGGVRLVLGRAHLGRRRDPLISDPPGFWALGNTPFERELAWRRWLEEGEIRGGAQRLIDSALKGWPLGSARFLQLLGEVSERPMSPRPRGTSAQAQAVGSHLKAIRIDLSPFKRDVIAMQAVIRA